MIEITKQIDERKSVSELTVGELQDIVLSTVRQQLNNHYKGLVNAFFERWDADNTALLDGLDQAIQLLKSNEKDE